MKAKTLAHAMTTMIHPIASFDSIKWERKGSYAMSVAILLALFLYQVLDRQMTGFIFNTNNVDTVNVPAIFFITMGAFVLWFVSNLAICSFMDGEGKSREIWIASSYALLPYILIGYIEVFLTNVLSKEAAPFLSMLSGGALLWSFILMAAAMYVIHQYSLFQTMLNLALTVVGIGVITFLLVLVYSLFQQVFVFVLTLYNEIMFRL